MGAIASYPQVFNLGHRAVADLFLDPVTVQEKVDGSQISFGIMPQYEAGHPTGMYELHIRSKGREKDLSRAEEKNA